MMDNYPVAQGTEYKPRQLTFSVSLFASGSRMMRRFKACSWCFLVGRSADRGHRAELFSLRNISLHCFGFFFCIFQEKVTWHKHLSEKWDTKTEQRALAGGRCLWATGGPAAPTSVSRMLTSNWDRMTSGRLFADTHRALEITVTSASWSPAGEKAQEMGPSTREYQAAI